MAILYVSGDNVTPSFKEALLQEKYKEKVYTHFGVSESQFDTVYGVARKKLLWTVRCATFYETYMWVTYDVSTPLHNGTAPVDQMPNVRSI